MVERLPGIFELTLEERPGGLVIQLYLVKGTPRNLLIDVGYGNERCLMSLLAQLEELEVKPDTLDIFLTHKHADHCGLAKAMQDRGAVIYMNKEEDRHHYDCLYYKLDHSNENAQKRVLARCGITEGLAPLFWNKYMLMNRELRDDGNIWKMTLEEFSYKHIPDGKVFSCGDYSFKAIHLRGHTYGQMGLCDRKHKLMFTADHILNRTTPIVGTSHCDEHLLLSYIQSANMLREFFGDYLILPAHEGPVTDVEGVMERICNAYRKKTSQVEQAVTEQEQTVWQIARQVYGLTPDKRTDAAFYNAKMITTKTFSMLEFLYDIGKISRREENGILYWSL